MNVVLIVKTYDEYFPFQKKLLTLFLLLLKKMSLIFKLSNFSSSVEISTT